MGERKQGFRGLIRGTLGVGSAITALSVVAVMAWAVVTVSSLTYDPRTMTVSLDQPAWGAEVFDAIHDSAIAQGLVRPANACGLGASSCFRCHNGTRAAAPGDEAWHVDHAKVNHSCVGCHNGNPRLMREQMAHQGLIADPRTTPAESCAGCHRDAAELDGLLARYTAIGQ